jgi:hypothetical protein
MPRAEKKYLNLGISSIYKERIFHNPPDIKPLLFLSSSNCEYISDLLAVYQKKFGNLSLI